LQCTIVLTLMFMSHSMAFARMRSRTLLGFLLRGILSNHLLAHPISLQSNKMLSFMDRINSGLRLTHAITGVPCCYYVQTRPDSKINPRSSIRSSRQRDQQTQTEYYAAIIGGGLHGRRWRTIVLVLVAHYSYREFGMSVSALYQFESFLKPLSPQRITAS
jgi:hypothetical protein